MHTPRRRPRGHLGGCLRAPAPAHIHTRSFIVLAHADEHSTVDDLDEGQVSCVRRERCSACLACTCSRPVPYSAAEGYCDVLLLCIFRQEGRGRKDVAGGHGKPSSLRWLQDWQDVGPLARITTTATHLERDLDAFIFRSKYACKATRAQVRLNLEVLWVEHVVGSHPQRPNRSTRKKRR